MSDTPRLEKSDGTLRVSGPLTVATLPGLWPELARAVAVPGDTVVSLAGVTQADSAAVACLVACARAAQAAGGHARFADLPEAMRVVIEVSDLGEVLDAA